MLGIFNYSIYDTLKKIPLSCYTEKGEIEEKCKVWLEADALDEFKLSTVLSYKVDTPQHTATLSIYPDCFSYNWEGERSRV